eukprot:TRINITY_DN19684_c0_g5_i3.p1 TRINITY_DN19684_c0_g5~~TRINITY_DN19684_c0_g5_i3.p1  ORF type:complete len:764 (+),score=218.45 TRINITY_DN19684_c0_g5_i3:96-2387(+)
MLSPVVWLTPAAKDLLRSTSALLRGEVPCPSAKLAALLEDAGAAGQCQGLLCDSGVRAALAKRLRGKDAPKELSDKSAAQLVDLLSDALKEKLDGLGSKAKEIAQKLPNVAPKFGDLEKALGAPPGEALKKDWVQWHVPGSTHDAKSLPMLSPPVLKERIALLAACGSGGALTESALALHVLENIEAYLAWELMIPGSRPASQGQEVVTPFDKKLSQEVAVRRVLSRVVPLDVAGAAAIQASDGRKLRAILEDLAAGARKEVVIPMYCAPPAPAEPKQPKEKKSDKGKDAAVSAEKKSGGAAPAPLTNGSLDAYRKATATQELQWHLLRYRMRPETTLSTAAAGSAAPAAGGAAAPCATTAVNGTAGSGPAGFAGIWASNATLPPGHTPFSWQHAKAAGMGEGFATTWADAAAPPGHTEHSWKKANAYGGSSSSAAPALPKAKAAAASAAPAAGGAAAAPCAPTVNGTAGSGPAGFAGTWASNATLPPGHTPFSWQHAKAAGMGEGFATTWADAAAPPGHTEHSWKKANAYGGSSSSAAPTLLKEKKAASAKGSEKAPDASAGKGKKAAATAPAAAAPAAGAGSAQPAEGSPEAALCKLDIRSGRIVKVEKVPNSDKLYLLQVNIGDEKPRQVVSGLQKHYKEADLDNRAVIVYCNIKPGKLAGCESQAMILAATKDKDSPQEICELLAPPAGVPEGTRPRVGDLEVGSASAGVSVKNISKVWAVVQPLLRASAKQEAVFSGTPLLMNGSAVTTGSLSDAMIS